MRVVGLARIAGMLVAGSKLDQRGAARVQPQPEGTSPCGAAQMLADRRSDLRQRRPDQSRCPPAMFAPVRLGEPQRVAGVIGSHLVVGDLHRGGDIGEERPGLRIGGVRSGQSE